MVAEIPLLSVIFSRYNGDKDNCQTWRDEVQETKYSDPKERDLPIQLTNLSPVEDIPGITTVAPQTINPCERSLLV